MVDTKLLDEKIKQSGLKPQFIIETLGITPNSFYRKKNNQIPMKAAEIYVLCDLLKITDPDDKAKIFYAESLHECKL